MGKGPVDLKGMLSFVHHHFFHAPLHLTDVSLSERDSLFSLSGGVSVKQAVTVAIWRLRIWQAHLWARKQTFCETQ